MAPKHLLNRIMVVAILIITIQSCRKDEVIKCELPQAYVGAYIIDEMRVKHSNFYAIPVHDYIGREFHFSGNTGTDSFKIVNYNEYEENLYEITSEFEFIKDVAIEEARFELKDNNTFELNFKASEIFEVPAYEFYAAEKYVVEKTFSENGRWEITEEYILFEVKGRKLIAHIELTEPITNELLEKNTYVHAIVDNESYTSLTNDLTDSLLYEYSGDWNSFHNTVRYDVEESENGDVRLFIENVENGDATIDRLGIRGGYDLLDYYSEIKLLKVP